MEFSQRHTLEDNWVCLEVKKHHTPGERDVDGGEQYNGLKDEHREGSSNGLSQGEGSVGTFQLLWSEVPIASRRFS